MSSGDSGIAHGTSAGMTWLVIGSSGFVGSAVVDRLRKSGRRVRTLAAPRLSCDPRLPAEQICLAAESHAVVSDLIAELRGVDCAVLAGGLATPEARWTPTLVGANSLLPGVVAHAAHRAGVRRLVHISSAAVQGRARTLTATAATRPFSAYSRSKALGETVLSLLTGSSHTELVIVRATSVQGWGRPRTESLRRIARSPFASVAGDGSQPSAVSSIDSLCDLVESLGSWKSDVPSIVLQPWEGLSVAQVLSCAGGKEPLHLPRLLCAALVELGYVGSKILGGRADGHVRRVEMMWFGQRVAAEWAEANKVVRNAAVATILRGERPSD